MSIAVRAPVPLNSRCSRKWVEPCWPSVSSREPTATQAPRVAERCPAMASVSTRIPPGRTERRMTLPSCSRRTSVPGAPAGPSGSASGTGGVAVLPHPVAPAALATFAAATSVALGTGLLGVVRGALGGGVLVLDDRVQRQLAALVDLGELDLHLLAHAQDVLDVLHALAADEPAALGGVQQAVLRSEEHTSELQSRGHV